MCPGDWFILGSDGEYRLKRRADFTSREWEPIPERDEEAEAKLVQDVGFMMSQWAGAVAITDSLRTDSDEDDYKSIIARVREEEST